MDDLLPIGEFAERSSLSPKRLRSYASEGILVPAAIDPGTGYRYYSPGQLHDAQVIAALRQTGMPLAAIRGVLRNPSQASIDAWASRLDKDTADRQRALALARSLLAGTEPDQTIVRESREATMTTLITAGLAETGPVRPNNEDAIVHTDRLAVVADGMGGLPGGEIASNATTGILQAAFTGRSSDELEAAIRSANWTIWARARENSELEGMGTTVCAAGLLEDGRLAVANVGDSRAYLWHSGELRQLTQDHTITADLVLRGELPEQEVRQHPHYGILTRALGVAPDVEIDSMCYEVVSADRIVLCSDGLFNEVTTAEIEAAVATEEAPSGIAARLVELALAYGGNDNVSVVVAEVAA
ncbi:MAG TPA: MerR family transcriptional regulator [Acidimicrobiales bacterium]|nr:MerR family transcriptional regulator [Acidimicrobiales bacterium]